MNPSPANGAIAETLKWRQKVVDVLTRRIHPQNKWLQPSFFQEISRKRDLETGIGSGRLEEWDKTGIFHPLIRYRYPTAVHRKKPNSRWCEKEPFEGTVPEGEEENFTLLVGNGWKPEDIHQPQSRMRNTTAASLEVATVENYVSWDNYEWSKGYERTTLGGVYYHPFQIFRFESVVRASEPNWTFPSFRTSDAVREHLQDDLNFGIQKLVEREVRDLQALYLLVLIEDRYLPKWRGGRYGTQVRRGIDLPNTWNQWVGSFDAVATLATCDLSIDEIRLIREELSWQGQCLDPNRAFYLLFRHFSHERRQRLEGKALLAWDYYEAAEMIGWFLKDATGQKQPSTDDINRSSGDWKKSLYGVEAEDINFDSGNILRRLLSDYTVDPVYKVLLVIEGESEEVFTKTWYDLRDIDLLTLGIQILVLDGLGDLKSKRVRQAFQQARTDQAAAIVVVDNDPGPNHPRANLQALIDAGLVNGFFNIPALYNPNRPIGALIWNSNFEEDNFTHDEIIQAYLMLVAEEKPGWEVDVDVLKAEIQQLQQNPKFDNWMDALNIASKRLTYPTALKAKIAKYLPRVLGDRENHMTRVIKNCVDIALLSTQYGPARPDGGFGYPIEGIDDYGEE